MIKNTLRHTVVAFFALSLWVLTPLAKAGLIDRGLFDDNVGGQVRLIYDDVQNMTWLGDASYAIAWGLASPDVTLIFDNPIDRFARLPNGDVLRLATGSMHWEVAQRWLPTLEIGALTDWRLPTGAEMSHLFNIDGISLGTPGPFTNIQGLFYWGEAIPPGDSAVIFSFSGGQTAGGGVNNNVHQAVWAVRSGDIGSMEPPIGVSEPSSLLLLGAGLLLCLRRRIGVANSN